MKYLVYFTTHKTAPLGATKSWKSIVNVLHMLDVVSSENREETLRFVLTFHGQATDNLPTGYRHITNSRPSVGELSADKRPTVGRQTTNCRPTGFFWGALLHNYLVNIVYVFSKVTKFIRSVFWIKSTRASCNLLTIVNTFSRTTCVHRFCCETAINFTKEFWDT